MTDSEQSKHGKRDPDREKRRELTDEERERLRQKIEQAKRDDPNMYPVF